MGIDGEDGADVITAVTHAGNTMTRIVATIGTGESAYLYGILNPASGLNNIVITKTGVNQIFGFGLSYTGTVTSGLPSNTAVNNAATGTTISATVSNVATNSWVAGVGGNDQNNGMTIAAPFTIRQFNPGGTSRASFDTNGSVSGSITATLTATPTNANWVIIIAEIVAPAVAAAANENLLLMGVG